MEGSGMNGDYWLLLIAFSALREALPDKHAKRIMRTGVLVQTRGIYKNFRAL